MYMAEYIELEKKRRESLYVFSWIIYLWSIYIIQYTGGGAGLFLAFSNLTIFSVFTHESHAWITVACAWRDFFSYFLYTAQDVTREETPSHFWLGSADFQDLQ